MEGSKSTKSLSKGTLGLALDVTCWGTSREEILGLSGQPSPLDGRDGGPRDQGSGHPAVRRVWQGPYASPSLSPNPPPQWGGIRHPSLALCQGVCSLPSPGPGISSAPDSSLYPAYCEMTLIKKCFSAESSSEMPAPLVLTSTRGTEQFVLD